MGISQSRSGRRESPSHAAEHGATASQQATVATVFLDVQCYLAVLPTASAAVVLFVPAMTGNICCVSGCRVCTRLPKKREIVKRRAPSAALCNRCTIAGREVRPAAFFSPLQLQNTNGGCRSSSDRCKQCSPAQSRAMLTFQRLGRLGMLSKAQLDMLPKTVGADKDIWTLCSHMDAKL